MTQNDCTVDLKLIPVRKVEEKSGLKKSRDEIRSAMIYSEQDWGNIGTSAGLLA